MENANNLNLRQIYLLKKYVSWLNMIIEMRSWVYPDMLERKLSCKKFGLTKVSVI